MLSTLAVVAILVWVAPFACLLGGIWLRSWQWALTSIPVAGMAFLWSVGAVILAANIDEHFDAVRRIREFDARRGAAS
jgi:hypothetical protein